MEILGCIAPSSAAGRSRGVSPAPSPGTHTDAPGRTRSARLSCCHPPGVERLADPLVAPPVLVAQGQAGRRFRSLTANHPLELLPVGLAVVVALLSLVPTQRSEERRVGKECIS